MSNSIALVAPAVRVIVGVDTHKHVHVAVAIDRPRHPTRELQCTGGPWRATRSCSRGRVCWAPSRAFGVEGTGLLRCRSGELHAPTRGSCRRGQPLRSTQASVTTARTTQSTPRPPLGRCWPGSRPPFRRPPTGPQRWVRQIKVARDTAVKARSSAIITLKTLIVNRAGRAPRNPRAAHRPQADRTAAPAIEPGNLIDPTASRQACRCGRFATRWLMLSEEIGAHDAVLDRITTTAAPTLREAFGIGPDSAAEMMIVAGGQSRTHPVRSGVREALRRLSDPRLDRGHEPTPALPRRPPPGQRGPLSDRDRPHALAPTDDRLRHAPHRPGPIQERHHPLPKAIRRPGDLQRTHHRPPIPRSTHRGRLTSHITTLLTYRGVNAVMESFFSTVKSELTDRFDTYGGREDGVVRLHPKCSITNDAGTRRLARSVQRHLNDARTKRAWILWKTAKDAVFHRLHTRCLFSMRKEQTTRNDQLNETVH